MHYYFLFIKYESPKWFFLGTFELHRSHAELHSTLLKETNFDTGSERAEVHREWTALC